MENVVPFLIGAVIVTVIILAIGYTARRSDQLNKVYGALAARYEGTLYKGGVFQRPSVRFRYRGAHVLIDIYATGGKHQTLFTQFHVSWPDHELRMRVYPERFMSQLGKLFGMEDLEIGSPAFDRKYIINGNDRQRIGEFLSTEVQTHTERLRQFMGNDDIFVGVQGGILLVKKRRLIRSLSQLERYVSDCLALFDAALDTRAEGITFVTAEIVPGSEEIICQICGEGIAIDMVFCGDCRTPHHEDCWEYYGACSTYGCGQQRFTRQ